MILVAIPFYVFGALSFAWFGSTWARLAVLVVVLPIIGWQLFFSVWFATKILVAGATACGALQGMPFAADGNERFSAGLWLSVSFGQPVVFGAILTFRKPLAPGQHHP
jgi:hypothetical protein